MQHKVLSTIMCTRLQRISISSTSCSFSMANILKCSSTVKQYHLSTVVKKTSAVPHYYTTFAIQYPAGLRSVHSAVNLKSKEPSKVEETVKVLKEEVLKSKPSLKEPVSVSPAPKRSLGKRIWDEFVHYYHGFRLLFIDLKVSTRLMWKILHGGELTRREHKQLVRTVSDLFRLVPFSVFIIVPFMELLLPVFLKLFPAMLPSTFQTISEKEMKFKKQLKVKIEMAKFLQDTLDEMALQSKGDSHSHTAKEFVMFFEKIRTTGQQASNEEILKFSKLFEDEITLDSLTRPQLIALCRLLELQPIGSSNFLRFQLRMKLRNLKADDQMIMKEGIDSLTVSEAQAACRARGMRALGIPEDRLRSQLQQWLELSLNEQIPPSLLLLSRALYLPENLPAPDQLKATLSSLPEVAATEAKYKIGEIEGKVDNKTKLELIKKEEEAIKKEAEERQQELLDQKKKEAVTVDADSSSIADSTIKEILIDKAPVLEDVAEQSNEKLTKPEEKEIFKKDLDDIEDALENIANEKKKLLIEKEEIEDLKEEMADYKQDIEDLKDIVLETGHKEIRESKAALRLSNKVNKMISKMDKLLEELTEERENLQQQINDKMKEGVSAVKESINLMTDLETTQNHVRRLIVGASNTMPFDGEVETIRLASQLLTRVEDFENVIILSDYISAIKAVSSLDYADSQRLKSCKENLGYC
ncbi:mitochondrial proton/calcium exchanger protein-like [Stegodyphus dumicola]|uniref:mitochondrial proton/calcium exchanger protein-like n=1 Tax=Stegodyphus dumicola TaxID=202533 RepID=UPI0015AC5EAC|nr:mitochondrial proton/calcium exchanger protein-like [Stegodyphus dumicola]